MRSYTIPTMATLLIVFLLGLPVQADGFATLNSGTEGETVDLAHHLVAGKLNIIDFHSDYCAPAQAVAPSLHKLSTVAPDLVVRKVDINRPGTRGIDWNSPVSQQYRLRSIPHFKIYDANGELLAEGAEAKEQVEELMARYGVK